jgi:L-serine dehydratase
VRRRAGEIAQQLQDEHFATDPLRVMDWVMLFALAVNEQNAAGGRIVTAPDQRRRRHRPGGPALLRALRPGRDDDGIVRFLLTATAIGILFKENASISAPRSAARARSAPPARWPRPDWPLSSAAPPSRSRTPPRSAWSTTSA